MPILLILPSSSEIERSIAYPGATVWRPEHLHDKYLDFETLVKLKDNQAGIEGLKLLTTAQGLKYFIKHKVYTVSSLLNLSHTPSPTASRVFIFPTVAQTNTSYHNPVELCIELDTIDQVKQKLRDLNWIQDHLVGKNPYCKHKLYPFLVHYTIRPERIRQDKGYDCIYLDEISLIERIDESMATIKVYSLLTLSKAQQSTRSLDTLCVIS